MWPLISVGASCLLLLVALTTEPVDAFGVCNCPSINRDGQASPSNGFLVLEKTTAPHRTARILHFESVESDPSVFIDFGHCLIDPEGLVFRSDSNGIHVLVADHNRILDASPAGLRTVARLPLDRIVALSSDFEGIRVWGLTSGQRRLFSVDPRSGELRFEARIARPYGGHSGIAVPVSLGARDRKQNKQEEDHQSESEKYVAQKHPLVHRGNRHESHSPR